MTSTPLVSVIIPTYNRAALLCQTIDNVFQQTYRNFELIVVDDGSTDETQSRLRQYGDRIRVITQANAGAAVARNRGIAVAHGEIIAFQDSDDLWQPTKLERQVALLGKMDTSVPCCLCNAVMRFVNREEVTSFAISLIHPVHEEGIWLNVPEVLATRFILFNQTVAIRREALERVGGFDEDLKYLEDYGLPLRLALEGPWAFIREPLVTWRGGSPGSFYEQALADPIALKKCELTIFERLQARVGDGAQHASLRRHLKRQLGVVRRQLRATELSQTDSPGARVIGRLLMQVDHYLGAAFRRSPWFPRPTTIPVSAVRQEQMDSEVCEAAAH